MIFPQRVCAARLEASLRSLRVETIDLYQFHSGPDTVFENEELWAMLANQKGAGKVRHLGISILGNGSERQARRARAWGRKFCRLFITAWTAGLSNSTSRKRRPTIWASSLDCRWPAGC